METEGFKAISRVDARVLILGTLPGQASLQCGEYYAQRRNRFWSIMQELFGISRELPYDARQHLLMEHGIALWDVCATAYRTGSLDSAIRPSTITPNDFDVFLSTHSGINLICFNGLQAAKLYNKKVRPGLVANFQAIRSEVLPSTSPANAAMTFEQKLLRWSTALRGIGHYSVTHF